MLAIFVSIPMWLAATFWFVIAIFALKLSVGEAMKPGDLAVKYAVTFFTVPFWLGLSAGCGWFAMWIGGF